MMNGMTTGMGMGMDWLAMSLIWLLVVLAIAALVKYLRS